MPWGQLADAAASYREAIGIYSELGRATTPPYPIAGLARVALALGNIDEALIHVTDIEARIDAGEDVNGAADLLWTCHQVLMAAKGPRANEILIRAHALLTERADLLDGADRETFLGNVPSHRAIIAARSASNSGAGS